MLFVVAAAVPVYTPRHAHLGARKDCESHTARRKAPPTGVSRASPGWLSVNVVVWLLRGDSFSSTPATCVCVAAG